METPPILDDCPPSPPLTLPVDSLGSTEADTRVAQLKKIRDNERTKCVICWTNVSDKNRCSPENCLHIFCFDCLVQWSKQKNLCPLCKKAFKIIIYNVKSATEYDKYAVVLEPPGPSDSPIDLSGILFDHHHQLSLSSFVSQQVFRQQRYRYQTQFNVSAQQNQRIQEFFGGHDHGLNYARLTPQNWRKYVYERSLYALPLPDEQGRLRECSAEFYRENPATTHRLIPWLNRELVVLMPNADAIPSILEDMRERLCEHDLTSEEIKSYFRPHLGPRTEHFIHEFLNFAKSPYDITGYDRIVDYRRRSPLTISTYEISSSESSDGDIQVVEEAPSAADEIPIESNQQSTDEIPTEDSPASPDTPATSESASTSSTVASAIEIQPVSAATATSPPSPPPPSVITSLPPPEHTTEVIVETSSAHEQTCTFNNVSNAPRLAEEVLVDSSDSDVEFVLARKPPHLRTPEYVDLDLTSDSDVIFVPDLSPKIKNISSDESDDIPLKAKIAQPTMKLETVAASSCIAETRLDENLDEQIPHSMLRIELRENEPSTSSGAREITNYQLAQQQNAKVKKYYAPKRKIVSEKSIFSSSTSDSSDNSSSSSSTSSDTSDEDWTKQTKRKKTTQQQQQSKRKPTKKQKIKTATKLKPLSELPSSGEAENQPGETDKRIRSVIIRKNKGQHYVEKAEESSEKSDDDSMDDDDDDE